MSVYTEKKARDCHEDGHSEFWRDARGGCRGAAEPEAHLVFRRDNHDGEGQRLCEADDVPGAGGRRCPHRALHQFARW